MKNIIVCSISLLFLISSCTVIRPGEVGVKQKLGKLSEKTHVQGAVWFNPFTTKVIKTNIQINNIELNDLLQKIQECDNDKYNVEIP